MGKHQDGVNHERFKDTIIVPLCGGGLSLKLVEGAGVVLSLRDNGGLNGSPPDEIKIAISRKDIRKMRKALKETHGIMKALGMK